MFLLDKEKKKRRERARSCFRIGFKYLAYVIVGLSSFGSALFTFFYSMMWGPEKSNAWLGSMFTGFFQSVLIIQPIKAVLTAVLFALILRSPIKHEENFDDDKDNDAHKEEEEEDEEEIAGDDDLITAHEIPIFR